MNAADFLGATAELAVKVGALERQVADLQLTLKQYSNAHRDLAAAGVEGLLLDGPVGDADAVFEFGWSDSYGSYEWMGVFIAGQFIEYDLLASAVEDTACRLLMAWERAEREAQQEARRAA